MSEQILDGPGGRARLAASGDEPEQGATERAPRPVSTTRAAGQAPRSQDGRGSVSPPNEKVHVELERVQHKCAALKREVKALRATPSAEQAAAFRKEAARYKQALSNIAYRLESDNGFISDETLRSIVSEALLLKGLKRRDRRRIAQAEGIALNYGKLEREGGRS